MSEIKKKRLDYEQASDINIAILKDKAEHFFQTTGKLKKYHVEYKGLSMENM